MSKIDFYLKLDSKERMPTVLSAFYKQDSFPLFETVQEEVGHWSYTLTEAESQAWLDADEEDEEGFPSPTDFVENLPEHPVDQIRWANSRTIVNYTPAVKEPVLDENGEKVYGKGDPYFVPNTPDYAIDLVGTIKKPTGNMLVDQASGIEYPEMAPLDGYHINIRLNGDNRRADVEALSDYFVDPEPTTPSRVWL